MRNAYKVTQNRDGVFIESCAWLSDAYFGVDLLPTKKQNASLAKFIAEKMNRAFLTGRRVQMDSSR